MQLEVDSLAVEDALRQSLRNQPSYSARLLLISISESKFPEQARRLKGDLGSKRIRQIQVGSIEKCQLRMVSSGIYPESNQNLPRMHQGVSTQEFLPEFTQSLPRVYPEFTQSLIDEKSPDFLNLAAAGDNEQYDE